MKLTIEPTEHFFMAGDVMVRLWTGTTDTGVEIVALVAGVAPGGGPVDELAEGLVSIPPPTPADAERWARSILGAGTTAALVVSASVSLWALLGGLVYAVL